MPYLIDTDIIIDHLAELPAASELMARLASEGIAISISYMEVSQGVLRSPERARVETAFTDFLVTTPILPVSLAVARRCAALREQLRHDGRRVRARALDLIAAAIALEHDLTLVTRNTADYADIPGLVLYEGLATM